MSAETDNARERNLCNSGSAFRDLGAINRSLLQSCMVYRCTASYAESNLLLCMDAFDERCPYLQRGYRSKKLSSM